MNKLKMTLPQGAVMVLMLCALSTQLFAETFQVTLANRWKLSLDQVKKEISTLKKNTTFPANPGRDDHQYVWKKADGKTTEGPVDVIVRRTQALIDQIKLISGAPSLIEEQKALNGFKGQANTDATFYKVCELRRKIAMQNPLLNFDEMIFSGHESDKPQFHTQQMAFFAKAHEGNSLYRVKGFKGGNPQFTDMLATAKLTNGRLKDEILSNKNPRWLKRASVFTPEINYDTTKVAFAWAMHAANTNYPEWMFKEKRKDMSGKNLGKYSWEIKYRIYEMGLDGSNLRMLTDFGTDTTKSPTFGPNMDEYDPTYLPNGRLLWVSERHNGGQRCGQTGTSGNMYTMELTGGTGKSAGMGSDIVRIGFHETNERSPVVDHNGKIIYSRWDYVDRHAYSAQSMWLTNPDGSDPRSMHGNYSEDDKDESGKPLHPISETDIRPIPGAKGKYMGIAGGHHEAYWGNLCVIDINQAAKSPGQIRWFFVGCKLPGDNWITDRKQGYDGSRTNPLGRVFSTPYPLDENFVIVADEKEVLLLDRFRNEILLFSTKDLFSIWAHSPLPIRIRQKETAIAPVTCQGKSCGDSANADRATISLVSIYETDTPWPSEIKIKKLRICQLVPRPKMPWETQRNEYWGWSDGALLKAVIGTVPVESDGSAYFQAPIEREIFFQAIDSTGMAVTSMLSGTYVHFGEHLTCIGCHEDKWKSSTTKENGKTTMAFKRGPAPITPEVSGSYPLTYSRLVRDSVFYPKCLGCHRDNNVDMDFEYWDIKGWQSGVRTCKNATGDSLTVCVGRLEKFVTYYGSAYDGAYGHTKENMLQMGQPDNKNPNVRSRSVPMHIGARACSLLTYLSRSHHGVDLSPEQFHRATLWMDLNSQDLGTYQHSDNPSILKDQPFQLMLTKGLESSFFGAPFTRQRNGEVVWPSWEHSGFDKDNPTGVQQRGKEFRPYDGTSAAGLISNSRFAQDARLMVRGSQLVLTDVPAGQLEVGLFNLAGRAVAIKSVKALSQGSVDLVSLKALGAGTYIARVRVNGQQVRINNQSIVITQ